MCCNIKLIITMIGTQLIEHFYTARSLMVY